jgi:hypothetical protein
MNNKVIYAIYNELDDIFDMDAVKKKTESAHHPYRRKFLFSVHGFSMNR